MGVTQQSPSADTSGGATTSLVLPKLYFPEAVDAMRKHLIERTMDFLAPFRENLPLLGLKTLLRDTFGLPASLAYPLVANLAPNSPDHSVPTVALQTWLSSVDFMGKGHPHRALDILRSPDRQYVIPADFRPIMAGILGSHPGLAFLQDSPEFQDRYAETVVHRIFYALDNSRSGRLTIRDLKK